MIGIFDGVEVDLDGFIARECRLHFFDILVWYQLVFFSVYYESLDGTWREEIEIVVSYGQSCDDESSGFWSSHQQLQRYPGTEGYAADPEFVIIFCAILQPVECGGGVGDFAFAAFVSSVAAPDAAEVYAQAGESLSREGSI